jgi:hypothetical protein
MIKLPGRRSDRVFLSFSFLVPDGKINHDRLAAFTFQLTAVSRPGRRAQSAAHISLTREQHTQTRTGAGRLNASVSLQELPTLEALHNEYVLESRSNALTLYCLQDNSEERGSVFLRKNGNVLPDYTASHPHEQ